MDNPYRAYRLFTTPNPIEIACLTCHKDIYYFGIGLNYRKKMILFIRNETQPHGNSAKNKRAEREGVRKKEEDKKVPGAISCPPLSDAYATSRCPGMYDFLYFKPIVQDKNKHRGSKTQKIEGRREYAFHRI